MSNADSLSAWQAFSNGRTALQDAKTNNAENEAKWLLQSITGWRGEAILFDQSLVLTPEKLAEYENGIARRAAHEPLAHIIGEMEFWSLPFAVTPATLIPRADSETLVEAVLQKMDKTKTQTILDLGTGSGCLLLSLLHECSNLKGVGVDRSPTALKVAAQNAKALRLTSRAEFAQSTWFDSVEALDGGFDIIISNPPYIPSDDMGGLMESVKAFEPHSALDGGDDGLDAYRAILTDLPCYLASGGLLAFEIGIAQADDVVALMTAQNLHTIQKHKDLSGIERVITGFLH